MSRFFTAFSTLIIQLLVSLCVLLPQTYAQSIPSEITVSARGNTSAVPGDADDPAIWIHPTDPAGSLVIGTDKIGNYVFVWDMNGQERQRIPVSGSPNNGDVRYGMQVGGVPVDIYAVGAETRLVVFRIDQDTRILTDITTAGGISIPQVKKAYGTSLYRRPRDGAIYAFVSSNGGVEGTLFQYQLMDDGAGRVKGVFVRAFGGAENGHHSEGIAVDDDLGYVYISEEDCCVHKFHADPDMGNSRLAVFAHTDGIDPDREGIGIYACSDGTGYVLLSSQGNKRVKVYRREGDPGNQHGHTLLTTIVTPFVGGTDGLDATNHPAGPNFPFGFMAKHDAVNKRFALFAWEDIAQTYLTICPNEPVPCEVVADFLVDTPSSCAPFTANFTDQSFGPVNSWTWDFGDGGTATIQNPSNTYNVAGTYTVKLTAASATCSDTETKINAMTVQTVPVAMFTESPGSGSAPVTVQFTDQSTGNPSSWLWNFGDGTTAVQQHPSHTYEVAGTYTVTLSVSNPCGSAQLTKMNLIGVTPPVAAPPGNLALDKLATASSVYLAFTPDRAVDGTAISPSFWRSAGVSKDLPNTWLRVDLGAAFTPTRAVVTWKENYFARNYRFQVSNTGGSADSEWTTVSTTTGALGTQNVLLTTPFPARYFRIRMDRNNKLNNQIFELEVYAD